MYFLAVAECDLDGSIGRSLVDHQDLVRPAQGMGKHLQQTHFLIMADDNAAEWDMDR